MALEDSLERIALALEILAGVTKTVAITVPITIETEEPEKKKRGRPKGSGKKKADPVPAEGSEDLDVLDEPDEPEKSEDEFEVPEKVTKEDVRGVLLKFRALGKDGSDEKAAYVAESKKFLMAKGAKTMGALDPKFYRGVFIKASQRLLDIKAGAE